MVLALFWKVSWSQMLFFCTLNSIPLISMPVLCQYHISLLVVISEIEWWIVLSYFQDRFISSSFQFLVNFRINLPVSTKKSFRDSDKDCIKCGYCLGSVAILTMLSLLIHERGCFPILELFLTTMFYSFHSIKFCVSC